MAVKRASIAYCERLGPGERGHQRAERGGMRMRRRILCATSLAAVTLVACSKKDSLYIDPGKPEPAKAPKSAPQKPPEMKAPEMKAPEKQVARPGSQRAA